MPLLIQDDITKPGAAPAVWLTDKVSEDSSPALVELYTPANFFSASLAAWAAKAGTIELVMTSATCVTTLNRSTDVLPAKIEKPAL